jgi:hypothetical protein
MSRPKKKVKREPQGRGFSRSYDENRNGGNMLNNPSMMFSQLSNKQMIENHLYNMGSMPYRVPMPNYSHPCFMQDNQNRTYLPPPPHMIPTNIMSGSNMPTINGVHNSGFDFPRVPMTRFQENQAINQQFSFLNPDYLRQMGLHNLTFPEMKQNSSNGQATTNFSNNPFQQY